MNQQGHTRQQIIEILQRRVDDGKKSDEAIQFLIPLVEAMEKDCFERFVNNSESYYQNIDNRTDIMIKSEMKVVREIKSALLAISSEGRNSQDELNNMEKEAKTGGNTRRYQQ